MTCTKRFAFSCPPRIVFNALTDVRDIRMYTRDGSAVSEAKVGGHYRLFGGSIEAIYTELSETRIGMKWRLSAWEDGYFSAVAIDLLARDFDECLCTVTHTQIPATDKYGNSGQDAAVERGWRERIFGAIKSSLGFGMEEEK